MGNPVVHWELMSKDPAKVSDFHAKIFGWNVQHHPELNYRVVETGGGPAWASSCCSPTPRAA